VEDDGKVVDADGADIHRMGESGMVGHIVGRCGRDRQGDGC
jgi:hypothetical protein